MHIVALLWLIFTWNMGATTNLWQGIGYLTTDPVCNCFAACSMLYGISWGKNIQFCQIVSHEKNWHKITRILALAKSWAILNDYKLVQKGHLALDNLTKLLFWWVLSFNNWSFADCSAFSLTLTLLPYPCSQFCADIKFDIGFDNRFDIKLWNSFHVKLYHKILIWYQNLWYD